MLPRILTLAAAFALCNLPAFALDISGVVLDKIGDPIPQAKVCVAADPGKCVNTGAQGEFHIVSGSAIRESAPGSAPYAMAFRRGTLTLEAPAPVKARLEWTGPGGRVLFAASDISLSRGSNVLSLPAGLPENGICFIRLRAGKVNLAWRAMLMGARANVTAGTQTPSPGPVLALSKASALTTLEVAKTGYRTKLFYPKNDRQQDAVIELTRSDDVGLDFTGSFTSKVIAIDRTNKTLITESVESECKKDVLVKDTVRDTSRYAFIDGKLWMWTVGECTAEVFSGTGTDPVGTWTLTDATEELPADLRTGCKPDSVPGDDPFENFSATYIVSETAVKGNVSVELCPGDLYGLFVTLLLEEDPSIALAKNTCKQLQYRNGKDETADLNFSKQADSLRIEFVYKTTTCAVNQDMALSDKEPVCSDAAMEEFLGCMYGSGFADLDGMALAAKTSASSLTPMSLERAAGNLRQGRSGPRESIFPRHGRRFGSSR